jgi:hypothetical protein
MDMLKKARKMGLQAVDKAQKELQTIIQTPNQQASSYGSYSNTPYQQYGQQHPPQMQNFQQQYATPNQPHQQGQHQQQYQGHPNHAQQPQYGQAPSAQQPPPIPQPYNQSQGQHAFVQQQPHQQYGQAQNQQYTTPPGKLHALPSRNVAIGKSLPHTRSRTTTVRVMFEYAERHLIVMGQLR